METKPSPPVITRFLILVAKGREQAGDVLKLTEKGDYRAEGSSTSYTLVHLLTNPFRYVAIQAFEKGKFTDLTPWVI